METSAGDSIYAVDAAAEGIDTARVFIYKHQSGEVKTGTVLDMEACSALGRLSLRERAAIAELYSLGLLEEAQEEAEEAEELEQTEKEPEKDNGKVKPLRPEQQKQSGPRETEESPAAQKVAEPLKSKTEPAAIPDYETMQDSKAPSTDIPLLARTPEVGRRQTVAPKAHQAPAAQKLEVSFKIPQNIHTEVTEPKMPVIRSHSEVGDKAPSSRAKEAVVPTEHAAVKSESDTASSADGVALESELAPVVTNEIFRPEVATGNLLDIGVQAIEFGKETPEESLAHADEAAVEQSTVLQDQEVLELMDLAVSNRAEPEDIETRISFIRSEIEAEGCAPRLPESGTYVEEVEGVFAEIVAKVDNLAPEKKAAVYEILDQITHATERLSATNETGMLDATEVRQGLQEIFTELFVELEIEPTPQLIKAFVELTLRSGTLGKETSEQMRFSADKLSRIYGTHEFITRVRRDIALLKHAAIHAYLVGKSVLRLYSLQQSAAA